MSNFCFLGCLRLYSQVARRAEIKNRIRREMIPEECRQEVDRYLQDFAGNKDLARAALEGLFDVLAALEEKVMEALGANDPKVAWAISEIQQLICWTPLRQFLKALAGSPFAYTRACAKGEICDQTGEFWGDPEVGLIAQANLFVMMQPPEAREGRICFGSERLDEILSASREAGLPIPGIRVTEL